MTATTVTTYTWGGRSFAVPAQFVGETVERIAAEEGACRPERLVEEAEPEASLLHALFEWRDDVAARNWRTHQARNVINSLSIHVTVHGQEVPAPAFISVGHVKATMADGSGYRPTEIVLSQDRFAAEAFRTISATVSGWQERYRSVLDVSPLVTALAEIRPKVGED